MVWPRLALASDGPKPEQAPALQRGPDLRGGGKRHANNHPYKHPGWDDCCAGSSLRLARSFGSHARSDRRASPAATASSPFLGEPFRP